MRRKRGLRLASAIWLCLATAALANPVQQTKGNFEDKFRQLEGEDWPTPTDYRNASGAPGYRYWQQKVDYDLRVRLDEPKRLVTGSAVVEQVFGIPGMGRYFVQGALNRDYTLVLGVVLVVGALIVAINALVDALRAWMDPRLREAG